MVGQNASYILLTSAMIVASALAVPAAALAPRDGERVAVIFPPWVDAASVAERVWAAGGRVVSRSSLGVVADSGSDRFIRDLMRSGAVLVLDAAKARALCGSNKENSNDVGSGQLVRRG